MFWLFAGLVIVLFRPVVCFPPLPTAHSTHLLALPRSVMRRPGCVLTRWYIAGRGVSFNHGLPICLSCLLEMAFFWLCMYLSLSLCLRVVYFPHWSASCGAMLCPSLIPMSV